MGVQFEIHDNLAEQSSEILDKLLDKPQLCMLLNPKLTLQQQRGISREHYVVTVEHEEKPLRTISRPGEQQSRPGGLSYGGIARIGQGRRTDWKNRDQEGSPTGKTESLGVSRNHFDNNEL